MKTLADFLDGLRRLRQLRSEYIAALAASDKVRADEILASIKALAGELEAVLGGREEVRVIAERMQLLASLDERGVTKQ